MQIENPTMQEDSYTILDEDFSSLSKIQKLVVPKIRKWMPYGRAFPATPPTAESIRKIEDRLRVKIPPIFIDLAKLAPNYGAWFGGIGDDFDSGHHTLEINEAFHQSGDGFEPLPTEYIMINRGFDGLCDCWKIDEFVNGEHPIYFVNVQTNSKPQPWAENFLDYWKRRV